MEKTPEEYQAELLRLYHTAQASAPAPVPEPKEAPPQEPQPEPTPPEPEPAPPMPEPLPTETVPPPKLEVEETPQEQPAIGWIQVITRSAGNARALAGVSVLVTNGTEEQVHLKHTAVTNESGETGKIPLPVPAASH